MDTTLIARHDGAADAQDDWYEFGFAKVEGSRRRGVASMPLPHAQTLLKWAGYTAAADLAGQLVIDPACGSGNTLLAAASALAARGKTRRWGAERVAQEIEHSLWGLDPDPIACHVADLRLRRHIGLLLPDLPATRRKTLQLHIHQTDSLVLPADARFDLVITNPPQVTARGVVISYAGFESKTPPRDVWLRFLEQSMRLVAYGGRLAIALPEALLTKPAAGAMRDELATEWTIERFAHLTGIFRSGPGTVMASLRRAAPEVDATAHWERVERLAATRQTATAPLDRPLAGIASRGMRAERRDEGQLPQAELATRSRGPWRYLLGTAERAFLARIAAAAGTVGRVTLGEIVTVSRGAEISKDAPDPSPSARPDWVALARGVDITSYRTRADRAWLPAAAFKSDPRGWRAAKILLPRVAPYPQAALDESGAAPHSGLAVLTATDPAALPWVLALLNSRPARAWLVLTQTAYTLARPAVDLDVLRSLPVPVGPEDARQRLAGLALELVRHERLRGEGPLPAEHYPVVERLRATIEREVSALYALTPEDQAIVDRWGGVGD